MLLVNDANESSANMNKQESTCTNNDSEPLKDTEIGDETEQKIGINNVNANDKDQSKEYSTDDEEVNVNETEKIAQKQTVISKWLMSLWKRTYTVLKQ